MRIRGGKDEEYLFPSESGTKLSENALKSSVKRYNKRRGIGKTSVHSFRHTLARKYLVEGAYKYYKHGLHEPDIIREETEKYCSEADSVKSFLDNVTVREKGCMVKSSALHRAYVEYCEASSYDPLDNKSFSQTLIQKGYEKKLKNSGAYFKNIKLVEEPTTPTTF